MEGHQGRSSRIEQIDAALDEIRSARQQAMAESISVQRFLRLAELADVEARWWEALSEHTRTRVCWRAALVAREHAQRTARHWRHRAAVQRGLALIPQAAVLSAAA